jgi:mycofactocin system creatininase family protein
MTEPCRLAELTWPEVAEIAPRSLLAVPLGATEQHGPHLPFTVDTEIAVELCERLGRARSQVVVAPAVPYGSSGEHAGFPGTLSIGSETTELVLVELVRSADAFAGVLLVCAHGGNVDALRRATAKLRWEGRKVGAWTSSGPPDDAHAGHTETSAMRALRPLCVHTGRVQSGCTRSLPDLLDTMRAEGVGSVSPNGVLGDPTGASAEEGEGILTRWTNELIAQADVWCEFVGICPREE